mmetsp:Transcript_24403/g.72190  ORF Transcript_24403/g.72190 Transcript_24403/m.72190 type:complete len:243 (-) Transcript_24403:24-752(-)
MVDWPVRMTLTFCAFAATTSACDISLVISKSPVQPRSRVAPSPTCTATVLTVRNSCAFASASGATTAASASRRKRTPSKAFSRSTTVEIGVASSHSSTRPCPASATFGCLTMGRTTPCASERASQAFTPPLAASHAECTECTAIWCFAQPSTIRPRTSSVESVVKGECGIGEYVTTKWARAEAASESTCSVKSTHSSTSADAPRSTSRSVSMVSPTVSPASAIASGKRRERDAERTRWKGCR